MSDAEPVTARDVSDALGIEVHDARGLLRRYHRQGLICKQEGGDPFHAWEYELTEKGLERLRWLKEAHEGTQ